MRIAGLVCLLVVTAFADDRADALREGDWTQRNRLLDELTEEPAEIAVPLLIQALELDDTFIAGRAAQMLRIYGDEARPAVPALIQALYHESPHVRTYAYETLHWLGRAAEGASPHLRDAQRRLGTVVLRMPFQDHVPKTREPTFGGVRTDKQLIAALEDADPDLRVPAAAMLGSPRGRTPEQSASVEAALRRALADEAWEVRGRAATSLSHYVDEPEDLDVLVPLLDDASPFVRAKAAKALVGKPGIAAARIAAVLKTGSLRARRRMATALADGTCPVTFAPALAALCDSPDRATRLAAVGALTKCGPAAAEPLGRVLHLLECDDGVQRDAVFMLLTRVRPGPGAIEMLVRAARRSSDDASRVVTILGGMGVDAHPALIGLLDHPSSRLRVRIYYDLVRAREATPAVLAALKRGANDPDASVRQAAAGALARLPKPDTATAAELVEQLKTTTDMRKVGLLCQRLFARADEATDPVALLDDEHWQLRCYALMAISRTKVRRPELIDKIRRLASDSNVHVKRLVPGALRQVSVPRESDVGGLMVDLASGESARVRAAMRTLAYAPKLAAPAVPQLVELARTGDQRTRRAAFGLLRRIGAPAVAASVVLLRDSDVRLRYETRDMLGDMPRDAVVAVVKGLRTDESPQVRIEAVRLLRRHSQIETLLEWLNDPAPEVRKEVANVFVGVRGPRSLPGLLRVLKMDDEALHRSALGALGRYKDRAGEIIPVVAPFLHHGDERTRATAAGTLGRMGRPADVILDGALASKDPVIRASALSGIRGRPDGLEILKRTLSDESVAVRIAACRICRSWKGTESLLVEAIADESRVVAREALEVTGHLTPVPKAAIPGAIQALTSRVTRHRARYLLMRLFPDSVKAMLSEAEKLRQDSIGEAFRSFGTRVVPYLLDELNDERAERRRVTVWALAAIGRDARDAVADLKDLAVREPDLAAEIETALGRIER